MFGSSSMTLLILWPLWMKISIKVSVRYVSPNINRGFTFTVPLHSHITRIFFSKCVLKCTIWSKFVIWSIHSLDNSVYGSDMHIACTPTYKVTRIPLVGFAGDCVSNGSSSWTSLWVPTRQYGTLLPYTYQGYLT